MATRFRTGLRKALNGTFFAVLRRSCVAFTAGSLVVQIWSFVTGGIHWTAKFFGVLAEMSCDCGDVLGGLRTLPRCVGRYRPMFKLVVARCVIDFSSR